MGGSAERGECGGARRKGALTLAGEGAAAWAAAAALAAALALPGAPPASAAEALYQNPRLEGLRLEALARDRAAKEALSEERAEAEAAALEADAAATALFAEERAAAEAAALAADAEARAKLGEEREIAEAAARQQAIESGNLCVTPFGIDIVGVSETILAIGALSGGLAANARKQEVEELNDKLRTINLQLRQEARSGTTYAPGLVYAPPGSAGEAGASDATEAASGDADAQHTADTVGVVAPPCDQGPIHDSLQGGKQLLNEPGKLTDALLNFEKALLLAKGAEDKLQERRAVRGIAAVKRRLGQPQQAITQLKRVLSLSDQIGNHAGDIDALGTIADLYAEMDDYEMAAKYYDMYIEGMTSDKFEKVDEPSTTESMR